MNFDFASLDRLGVLFSSPTLLIASVAVLAIFVLLLSSDSKRWIGVGLLLFLAIPAPLVDVTGRWLAPPFPFSLLVQHARTMTAVLAAVGTVILLSRSLTEEQRPIPALLVWFFVMHVALCLRHIMDGSRVEALGRLGVYTIIFAGFGFALSRLWGRSDRFLEPLKAIGLAGSLYAAITAAGLVLFWGEGSISGRWFGISGNPNHAGLVGAVFLPALLGLASYKGFTVRLRSLVLVVIAVMIVQTLLTGSRGAVVSAMIGIVVFYRVRLGRFFLLAVPTVLLVWVFLRLVSDDEQDLQRLTSTGNTRSGVFLHAFETIGDNLLFGNTSDGINFVENGYLAFVMHTGVSGVAILIGLVVSGSILVIAGLRGRPRVGDGAPLLDGAIAGVATLAANNLVEATLLSNLSQTIFIVYLYVVPLQVAVRAVEHAGAAEGPPLAVPRLGVT